MAEKILKGINFPGLEDTYIVPEVDDTLSKSGQAADAKVVGEALSGKQPIGNYVKSINGNVPDENGNVEIEVGSGGSSGSSTTRETILAEQVLVFSEISNGNGLGQWYGVESPFALVDGAEYIVDWNGTEYDVVAVAAESLGEGAIAIGNLSLVLGDSSTDEPFIFVYGSGSVFGYATNGTYRVAIYKINTAPSSIQSDWNVTDETNPAYIKNKPFGEIPNTWVPLLASREFGPFYTNASYGVQMYTRIATFRLVIGETYRITWDGEVYECAAQDVNAILPGGIALGNGAAFGLAGNNEPFIIYIANGYEGYMSLTDTAAGATHTVGIEEIGTVIHKIEPKYLHNADWNIVDKNEAGYIANRPFGVVPSGTAIVEETTFNFAANTLHHFPLPNIGPFDYKVEFDGIEYFATGEVYETDSIPQYGFTISTPEDGELFLLVKNFEGREGVDIIAANEGEHTFKITAAEDIIEKIDSKYLPDDIGGSSGSALPEVTTEDAGKFLRVTDEGIWAAVSIPNAEGVGF